MLFPSIINMSQHNRLLVSTNQLLSFCFVSLFQISHDIVCPLPVCKRNHDILKHISSLFKNIFDHGERLSGNRLRLTTETFPHLFVQLLGQIVSRTLLEFFFFYIKINSQVLQDIQAESLQVISFLVFFHQVFANIIHIIGDIHTDTFT